ncbi:MAG: cysteine--tRNA ligase, partial [Acidimicrobiales bacterium]
TDLDEGRALLRRLQNAARCVDGADPRPFAARVRAALDDDLDLPGAVEAVDHAVSRGRGVSQSAELLGVI